MNVDTYARLNPASRSEGTSSGLQFSGGIKLVSNQGRSHSFQAVFRQDATNRDVFSRSLEPLLDLFVEGYNCAVLAVGESSSGKSYTLGGDGHSAAGVVQIVLEALFPRLENTLDRGPMTVQRGEVHLKMFEIYNETIRDLMTSSYDRYLHVDYTPQDGFHVKDLTAKLGRSVSEAVGHFQEGWSQRTDTITDYGPAQRHAATICEIQLSAYHGNSPEPTKSVFSFMDLPALEKLGGDLQQIQLREGLNRNKSLLAFRELIDKLAQAPQPIRVIDYSGSVLTSLLTDILGGNCNTQAIVHFKPQSATQAALDLLVTTSNKISRVTNFPIINDNLARGLLAMYRTRIRDLEDQISMGMVRSPAIPPMGVPQQQAPAPPPPEKLRSGSTGKEELGRLKMENHMLIERNEQLQRKLNSLEGTFGDIAHAKSDLSSKLITTEDEKLKMSKALVDLQIENNKVKEEAERAKFELTNKILTLENELMELDLERDRLGKKYHQTEKRVVDVERNRKDMANEYVSLKSTYSALRTQHNQQLAKNDQLGLELLSLANARQELLRQQESLKRSRFSQAEAIAELDRIRAIVTRLTDNHLKAEDVVATDRERSSLEKKLFGSSVHLQGEMERLKDQYDLHQEKLETKLLALGKELQRSQQAARQSQHKLAEQTTKMIKTSSQCKQLESQINKLQIQLKELNDQYMTRLTKYVQDIADFVDNNKSDKNARQYVEQMLADLKNGHRTREDQLSNAARSYKTQIQKISKKHEELLVAYRLLTEELKNAGLKVPDFCPEEYQLVLSETELESANRKEINNLTRELQQLSQAATSKGIHHPTNNQEVSSWEDLRKQLREFTLNTQQELETERATLLTRVTVAEERLKESQDYIDVYLFKYKEEIVRLRNMLGLDPNGGVVDPLAARSIDYYPKQRSHRP